MADDFFANFYRVDFKASATIDGVEVPITDFTVGYKLDSIPSATIIMPLGRNAVTGVNSAAQGLISKLKPFSEVKIYVTPTYKKGRAAPEGAGLSQSKTLIFDGFAFAPQYTRSSTQQGLTLSCIGHLGRLAGSTQMVEGITISKSGKGVGTIASDLGAGTEVRQSMYDSILNFPLESDLWGAGKAGGIRRLMLNATTKLSAWKEFSNAYATDELDKINTGQVIPAPQLSLQGLTGADVNNGFFRRSLAANMANAFYGAWSQNQPGSTHPWGGMNATLWDVLIVLSKVFYFRILPVVAETATMPTCSNLGGEPYVTIYPDEHTSWDYQANPDIGNYSYVTKVGLKSNVMSTGEYQDKVARTTELGYASIDDSLLGGSGQLRLVDIPAWALPMEASGAESLNPGGSIPDAGDSSGGSNDEQGKQEQAMVSSLLGDGLAQLILHDNIFLHRTATIKGRFRLDIAPGSLVSVITPGESFSGVNDVFFALVDACSLSCGSRAGVSYAYTRLDLVAVRTQNEHDTISSKVEVHPLYVTDTFRGCPLVAGLE